MPHSHRSPVLALAATALLLLAGPGDAGGPALAKPVRLGRPAPVPKFYGMTHLRSIAFSPDGKRLAWVFGEGVTDDAKGFAKEGGLVIDVWDVARRRLLKEMRPEKDLSLACSPLRFTPAGERLVLSTWRSRRKDGKGPEVFGKLCIWESDSERETGELAIEEGTVFTAPLDIAVHPGGERATVAHCEGGYVVDLTSGKRTGEFSTKVPTESPVLSPDGKLLAGVPKEGTFHVWQTGDGKELRRLEGLPLAFSPDGKAVAAQHQGKICLWDLQTGKPERELPGKTDARGRWFCFSADGKLLAWNDAGKVTVADRGSGKPLATVEAQPGPLAFSPDGATLALACPDSTALLWDLRPLRKAK
jgi:hypothetical protein